MIKTNLVTTSSGSHLRYVVKMAAEEGSDDFSAFLSVLRSIKDSAHSSTLTEVGYMLTLGLFCILSNAFDAK